ncbi:alcohol acyltransferase 9 [Typha latifolia]|uniref:alcohol acyltransferase 9 n=1 Tax=Typha latifolia TaxID=4733 RepID=UPI003C2F74A8
MEAMTKSIEIPDCYYPKEPTLVCPSSSTPRHTLYLSNLDDQKFLRFSIKYLYVFKRPIVVESLKASLSKALVEYYPLAGRLRSSEEDEEKLEVDCNGEGALLAEGYVDLTADEFLKGSAKPNRSWRKLLYRVEAQNFVGVPPLIIQVTHLRCGGMILCTAINHCLCDGIGTAQFLHAWAQINAKPNSDLMMITPFHDRHMLKPRIPLEISFSHPEFNGHPAHDPSFNLLTQILLSQPLAPVSLTFTPSHVLHLKKQCIPSLKCTSFEALASHVWRAWVKSLDLPASLRVKLLFSVNVRKKLKPELPRGYYGNGFVLGCAETSVNQLVTSNAHYGVKLVQEAKNCIDDSYIRSMIDLLEEKRMKPDLSASLVISSWSKLGLEDLDFGEGRPLHMGTLASEIYCLFLPVTGDLHAFNVLISVPQAVAERFEHYCLKGLDSREEKEDIEKVNGGRGYCLDVV